MHIVQATGGLGKEGGRGARAYLSPQVRHVARTFPAFDKIILKHVRTSIFTYTADQYKANEIIYRLHFNGVIVSRAVHT